MTDGTFISSSEITTSNAGSIVGVVFELDGNGKAKTVLGIINSGETKYSWAESNSAGQDANISTIVCTYSGSKLDEATFSGDTDGSDNLDQIAQILPSAAISSFPAFNYARNYDDTVVLTGTYQGGWYLPSIAELAYIYRNKDILNQVLTVINNIEGVTANTIFTLEGDGGYWSSSQHSSGGMYACYATYDGYCSNTSKVSQRSVCAVHSVVY